MQVFLEKVLTVMVTEEVTSAIIYTQSTCYQNTLQYTIINDSSPGYVV